MPQNQLVRVLIIDDDEDDYILTRDLLGEITGRRFEVAWEMDWDRALEAIRSHQFDIYLIDFRLGSKTGLDLIREANRTNCAAPLILMTGQGEREIDYAAMRAGAADYLEKGAIDATLLERTIRYAMQKKQSEEQLERRVQERTAELEQANRRLEREIRERVRAEEALREVDHRKDVFLATLAHELRNPLTPICNALEILRLSSQNPTVIERSREMMHRQVHYMIRLIDDLLDLSRITRGKIHLRREQVRLEDVVQHAIEGSDPAIGSGRHRLEVEGLAEQIILWADGTRLTQVLINLLNNAAKYMDPGGLIRLNIAKTGDRAVLRVIDQGIGIPPEVLPLIFQMFGQADRSRDRSQGGLGIGLSLVRALVELHGGTVEAFSEGPGKGSEFVVSLPLGKSGEGENTLAVT